MKRTRRSRILQPAGAQIGVPLASSPIRAEVRFIPSGDAQPSVVSIAWGLAAFFLVCYVAALTWFAPLALQDFPNHLARVAVMADLIFHHGARFGLVFQYHFLAIPYILGDLVLVCATELIGITRVATLWGIFVFLSLPCALLFYLRTTRIGDESKALLLILSAYLSTDWFYLVGFLEFRLGVAIVLVALGVAEVVRRRPTAALFGAYAGVLTLGYLTHLTTLVFITASVGASAVLRLLRGASRLSTEIGLLIPCWTLLLWHFASGYAFRQSDDRIESPYVWGTLLGKFIGLGSEFARFDPRADRLMAAALIVCLVAQVWRARPRDFKDPAVVELLALAGTMTALYLVLPMGYSEAFYVDIRALPLAGLFAILALLSLPNGAKPGRAAGLSPPLWIASFLVVGNLAYLVRHLDVQSLWLSRYRAVVAALPRNAWVFPVYTHAGDGSTVPFLHAYSFATIDRGALVPYLQTGDTGNPQKYIRYRHRPYAPVETWYGDIPTQQVDWASIACQYDYLLATKPFEPARLGVLLQPVFENESAALFAVAPKGACVTPR